MSDEDGELLMFWITIMSHEEKIIKKKNNFLVNNIKINERVGGKLCTPIILEVEILIREFTWFWAN